MLFVAEKGKMTHTVMPNKLAQKFLDIVVPVPIVRFIFLLRSYFYWVNL